MEGEDAWWAGVENPWRQGMYEMEQSVMSCELGYHEETKTSIVEVIVCPRQILPRLDAHPERFPCLCQPRASH